MTSVLHVVNGDATRVVLERTGIAGEISVYADVLYEGPVTGFGVEERARFHAGTYAASYDDALDIGRRWQSAFERHREYDVVILWFEHDLFDQLLLSRHLAWFEQAGRSKGLELICTDRYLGPLSPAELAALYPQRESITRAQLELGARTWRAFTGDDPLELQRIADGDTSALRFLHGALIRFLEEYPSTFNGLGRIDAQILSLLNERDYVMRDLFAASAQLEERNFLGDTTFFDHVRALSEATTPLVDIAADDVVSITSAGRDVVAGKTDAIALNGIDRWLGGVHLQTTGRWRWDPNVKRLVAR